MGRELEVVKARTGYKKMAKTVGKSAKAGIGSKGDDNEE